MGVIDGLLRGLVVVRRVVNVHVDLADERALARPRHASRQLNGALGVDGREVAGQGGAGAQAATLSTRRVQVNLVCGAMRAIAAASLVALLTTTASYTLLAKSMSPYLLSRGNVYDSSQSSRVLS